MNVLIKTSMGNMEFELFEKEAPITVENFLSYIKDGFYKDTIFHRVIPGFMIQGGGFDTSFSQKATKAQIKNEAANQISNKRGTIAMARTQVIDSATSQFFINSVDNNFLDYKAPTTSGFGYCVFGKLVSGEDTLDAISKVKTATRRPHADVPVDNVVILDIEIL